MALTGTDLFGSTVTSIAGVLRSGEAEITFTDDDSNEVELVGLGVNFAYSHEPALMPMPGGKLLIVVRPATGMLSIDALIGTDMKSFVEAYGDPCNINSNYLTLEMSGDLACTSPTLQEAINAYESATFELHNVWVYDLGFQTEIRGLLVRTNIKAFVLNAKWATV